MGGRLLHTGDSEVQGKWAGWEAALKWIVEQTELNGGIRSECTQALDKMQGIAP